MTTFSTEESVSSRMYTQAEVDKAVQAERERHRAKLEALVRELREATVGIGNYGPMRPLGEIERIVARACADLVEEALLRPHETGKP